MAQIPNSIRKKLPRPEAILHLILVELVVNLAWNFISKKFEIVAVREWGFLALTGSALFAVAWYLSRKPLPVESTTFGTESGVAAQTIPEAHDEINPNESYFKNKTIRIAELANGMQMVSDKTLEDCLLQGPAAIHFRNSTVQSCEFSSPRDDVMLEVPPGKGIPGMIIFRDCKFSRCTFDSKISILITKEQLAIWEAGSRTVG